jgi:hypothetical protein
MATGKKLLIAVDGSSYTISHSNGGTGVSPVQSQAEICGSYK